MVAPSTIFIIPISATDSNLNGDSAGDRAILNLAGIRGAGSGVTALTKSTRLRASAAGPATVPSVVGDLATNPTAQYIVAGAGALATSGRDTLATAPTNDFSLSTYKDISTTEGL